MVEDFCANKAAGTFRVAIDTIPCGDSGVTCTKAVTFYLYNQVIHLTKDDEEPVSKRSIAVVEYVTFCTINSIAKTK